MVLGQLFANGLKILTSKKVLSKTVPQRPLAFRSRRASPVAVEFLSNVSPSRRCSNGSRATSRQNSFIKFANVSLISMWRTIVEPPLGQCKAWVRLKISPHGQLSGAFYGFQLYPRMRPSQNSDLFNWNPYRFSGSTFSQADAPFSDALSSAYLSSLLRTRLTFDIFSAIFFFFAFKRSSIVRFCHSSAVRGSLSSSGSDDVFDSLSSSWWFSGQSMPSPSDLSGSEINSLSIGKGFPLEVSAGKMLSLNIASDVSKSAEEEGVVRIMKFTLCFTPFGKARMRILRIRLSDIS